MQFSVAGNNNGVVTLTTPTLTPTTMRNIEQSILGEWIFSYSLVIIVVIIVRQYPKFKYIMKEFN